MNKPIAVTDFKIKDPFFTPYQNLVRNVVIPYQRAVFENAVPGVEKSCVIQNFRIAAGLEQGEFYGMVFQDSDLGKWLEAASYSLMLEPDEALEKDCDELIDLIGRCQQEDGYLNTYFTVKEPEHRWQNLHECHELYCAGHLIEAAAAYYEATGKDKFLNIMCRMADCICNTFGREKQRGVPGHPEIELALMRLYHVTGKERYKDMCEYFVYERGTEPNFFAEETKKRGWKHFDMDPEDVRYAQNQCPVTEQTEAVGHAVRAVYLYTGMAELAAVSGDEKLLAASERLFRNIVDKKLYITGAVGATRCGEAFSVDYELPNDTAYAETCASVGLIFFMHAMLAHRIKGEYADTMERALYNSVLSGMQLDGKKFFYVNPLEVNPGISGEKGVYEHVLPERPGWFGCACCPPNVARLLTSLSKYAFSYDEDTVYAHLYLGGDAVIDGVSLEVDGAYPVAGDISYRVTGLACDRKHYFAVRIPGWCGDYSIMRNGEAADYEIKDGYAYLSGALKEGDEIILYLSLMPERIYANPMVRQDAGCVAVMRGPLCYCFEGVDQEAPLEMLRIARGGSIQEDLYDRNLLGGVVPILAEGYRLRPEERLYSKNRPEVKSCVLKAIPYYAWANRGLNQMRVWLPEL